MTPAEGWVPIREVARRVRMSNQYLGLLMADHATDLRTVGDLEAAHLVRIHPDDVETLVWRVVESRLRRGGLEIVDAAAMAGVDVDEVRRRLG